MSEQFTPKYVADMVDIVEYHHFPGTNTVTCCVVLFNGYSETGVSTCYDTEKFDITLGKEISYNTAMKKMRALENYRTRANRHDARSMRTAP